ncbi:MAG TPA: serine hydrolase [Phenylobacterium sp.]|uniref:D-alanyl-D-alanine carboxypeptidase family protein n=1 Tax=Phenylobacterium sp. TaxID=1871053 RepID=UPI002B45FC7F|nr:serine hydrolase [Phenylobacterium sp.]HKR89077.1 serine hydrolase [Phenylobacterium sp.]
MPRNASRIFVSIGLAAATLTASLAAPAQAQVPYFRSLLAASESKYAAIVVDAKSGEVLYSNHGDSPRYPASLTKMMTLYLTFEAVSSGKLRLEDRVVFSPRAAAQAPTKLGVSPGESITVAEAIQGMAILSANDAAMAMAEKLGGSEGKFTSLMTLRAQELGMQSTRFVNPNGLPDSRQITTARDMAILSRALMRDYPQYYHYFSQAGFQFRGRWVKGHNHLLGRGIDGLKTGYTRTSGFNIAISGVRDNRRLVVVVMGGPSVASRDQNAEDLLVTGFDVLSRRARGEQVTVAQNLSEPLASGPVQRPPTEQGDGDQDNLQIVLAEATPPPRSTKLKVIESRPAPRVERAEPKRQAKDGGYAVQVGTFRSKADARRQIAFVQDRFGKHLGDATGETDRQAGRYRTVFTGLTKREASATCGAMHAKRLACEVMDD